MHAAQQNHSANHERILIFLPGSFKILDKFYSR